jgi:Domain of unknown function (DUF1707)
MSSACGWGRSGSRASQPSPNMRISNDERTEVADRLSKHYGDGRLDEEEFNERLDRAMKAKTHGDLAGLLDDLPDGDRPTALAPQRQRPGPRILPLALIVLVAIAVGQAVARSVLFFPFWHVPWLLIGIVVFLCWRFAWRRRV